eukprot:3520962-Pleurochrysis_carterae.AAC.1
MSCCRAETTAVGIIPSAASTPAYFPLEYTAAHAASPYPGSAVMRASVGTGAAAGIAHSRRCTSKVVSCSSTAASAARRPASPASDFSAARFDVAAAGSSTPGGS